MSSAADGYERFYAEKLWELLPPYYRDLDGTSEPPGALRAFVEVIAAQALHLRRSQDRLWEDQFVERADDWAVPYIGDLVATRMVSALLARARRIDVAKTVYYRRRAGTPRVLEELISDIAGWEGVVTEGFRRLARSPHGLDPALGATGSASRRQGRWSGTPPGGLADLRHPLGAQLTRTPFDELHRTPDLRAPRGRDGRHGITRVVFNLYRLTSYRVEGVTPRAFAAGFYTFDPSGRDVPLFARRTRAQALSEGATATTSAVFGTTSSESPWEDWRSARPWEIPFAIPNRLLADVAYDLDPNALTALYAGLTTSEKTALRKLYGLRITSEHRLAAILSTTTPATLTAELEAIRIATIAADCGKARLLDVDEGSIVLLPDGATPLALAGLQADELSTPAVTWAAWEEAAIDAEKGRFVVNPAIVPAGMLTHHHHGGVGVFGAGVHDRSAVPLVDADWLDGLSGPPTVTGGGNVPSPSPSGVVFVGDNQTYTTAAHNLAVVDIAVRSTAGRRPYLSLNRNWRFVAPLGGNSVLTLDGLWIGARGGPRAVVLEGGWERVEIRCCTLDPGGRAADGSTIPAMTLRVEGQVERLVVQSAVLGQIVVTGTGSIGRLEVSDSVLDAAGGIPPAVFDLPETEVTLARTTVLGTAACLRMWASDTLFSGGVTVTDVQNGCFRFSAAHTSSLDHVPHPYQSAFHADAGALFVSTLFGNPGYALLSNAPEAALVASADDLDGRASIHSGASNDGEMGASNALLWPVRDRALRAKVEEFLPFGLLPVFVYEC